MQKTSPPKDPESFRDRVGLPALVTVATARILYVAAVLTPDWQEAFATVYTKDVSASDRWKGWAKLITLVYQESGIERDGWASVHQALAQARFDELRSEELEESSTSFGEFSKKLHRSIKMETQRLDPAKLVEVYLMAHQPTWPTLLSEVLPEARYDTRELIREFARLNRVPNSQSLTLILSCMR